MPNAASDATLPLPESVTLAATEWFVRLQARDDDALRADWQRWHDADTSHAAAWQRLTAFGAQLRTIPPAVAHGTLLRRQAAARQSRRRVLGLLLMAGTGAAVWEMRDSATVTALRADITTGVGERRTVRLDDGTQLTLNTDSAVNIQFSDDMRRLVLLRGEIAITTGADAGRSHRAFYVATRYGRLQALGTRFVVRQDAASAGVTVLEGAVRVEPANEPTAARVLAAGQSARFDDQTVQAVTSDANAIAAAAAWTQGMLVVHAMPLARFLAELGRYRRGHLGCAPEIADMPVSGIYPIDDTDRVLDMLSRSLPVDVQRYTRWWVRVQPGPLKTTGLGRTHT